MWSQRTGSLVVPFVIAASILALAAPPCAAQTVRQLTDLKIDSWGQFPTVDGAGDAVYANVSADLLGVNPEHAYQLMRFDAATGAASNVAFFEQGITAVSRFGVSVSDDGVWLAFISDGDLTGSNHDRSDEIFAMRSDGTQLSQVTNDPAPNAGSVLAMTLSGDGGKIFFVASSDPLGTNPGLHRQLFAIGRDGTGLTQLTTFGGANILYIAASDDGTRAAFLSEGDPLGTNADGNSEVFAVDADGTNLRQLTTTTGPGAEGMVMSGNGATLVFHSYGDPLGLNIDGNPEVFAIEWNGSDFRQITDSTDPISGPAFSLYPSITDDAQTIFFTSTQGDPPFPPGGRNTDGSPEIWKAAADGSGQVPVTTTPPSDQSYYQRISGDGSRMAFTYYGEPCDGSAGPPGVTQMCVADTAGGPATQLISLDGPQAYDSDVEPSGSRVVFGSNGDLTGGDPDRVGQLYVADRDGGNLTQITSFTTGTYARDPAFGENETIVFLSDQNDDAQNPTLALHVMRILADGTGALRLTDGATVNSYLPEISRDGSTVVFGSYADLTGQNADASFEVFKVGSDGTGMAQLTDSSNPMFDSGYARVDATGTWLVFTSNADLAGGNADGSYEVFRMRTDGTGLQQLTDYPDAAGSATTPDISGAGDLVVMALNFDNGNNPDHGYDLYSWDAVNGLVQLTSADGNAYFPRLSDDGAYTYFTSDGSFTETDPDRRVQAYRIRMSDGAIERVDGLAFGSLQYPYGFAAEVAPDADGDVATYAVSGNFTQGNMDRSSELIVLDLARAPAVSISPGPAPTQFDWDLEAGPIRYDAIRGDVAALAAGGPGEVDLGTVLCLEDDKPGTGAEDADTPASGQAFFYLYRGSEGLNVGPGSYGTSSDGAERVAFSGDCD